MHEKNRIITNDLYVVQRHKVNEKIQQKVSDRHGKRIPFTTILGHTYQKSLKKTSAPILNLSSFYAYMLLFEHFV